MTAVENLDLKKWQNIISVYLQVVLLKSRVGMGNQEIIFEALPMNIYEYEYIIMSIYYKYENIS